MLQGSPRSRYAETAYLTGRPGGDPATFRGNPHAAWVARRSRLQSALCRGGSHKGHSVDFPADASYRPYHPAGYLLFQREETLFAQAFDTRDLDLAGTPIRVADDLLVSALGNTVSVADDGTIVYRSGSGGGREQQFIWFDRSGVERLRVGNPDPVMGMPAMSPDGRRIAVGRLHEGESDVWLLEAARGVLDRFTTDPGNDVFPIWSPDGQRIVFTSTRVQGAHDLYVKDVDGASPEQILVQTTEDKFPTDWSPDGRHLLYFTYAAERQHDIWALPMEGDADPFPVVQTEFEERNAKFSPDGSWIAYQSNESGRFEVYLQRFPGPGGKLRLSTEGGAQVRWRSDGRELFYVALDGRLMAVPLAASAGGDALQPGVPVPLFSTRMPTAVEHIDGQNYMVSEDGQRFLVNTVIDDGSPPPIAVIVNWMPPDR